jgi:hypothetical protein
MPGAQPSLDGVTLVLILLFFTSGIVGVIGHLVLYFILNSKGVRVIRFLSNVPFYAVIVYFRQGPPIRSKALDVFALAVALSVPILILAALLLFPEMRGAPSPTL